MKSVVINPVNTGWKVWLWAVVLVGLNAGTLSADQNPYDLVQSVSVKLQSQLMQNRQTLKDHPDQLYALVENTLLPLVDGDRVARWVLGRHWRGATPDQRQRFINGFKNLLIRGYANTMLEYADDPIEFMPLNTPMDANDVLVRSEIRPKGQSPWPVQYSLHRINGEWKVYDVVINGISLVTNYRAAFDAKIRQDGLEALLSSLATFKPIVTVPKP